MNDFLTAVFRLATFRGTPAAMPAAPIWLAITCAVFLGVMLLVLSMPFGPDDSPLTYVFYNVIIYGTVALLLLANRRGHRLVQTLIAMLAVDNLLTVGQVFIFVVAMEAGISADLPMWLVAVWLLFAQSRILASALEWNLAIAFAFLFVISLLGATLVSATGPSEAGTAQTAVVTGLVAYG